MEQHPSSLIRCCLWIARPVKAPVSINRFVTLRVISMLFIAISMIGSILSLILLPWKTETLDNRTLHFGVWKICKLTPHEKPYFECFQEFYNNEEVEVWFYVWRWMLVIACCLLIFAFCSITLIVSLKNNNTKYAWTFASCNCLVSGILKFCSLILFHIQFEFGFAEGARERLGWSEETEMDEIYGYLYNFTWCIMALAILTSYLCYCTKHLDQEFFNQAPMYQNTKLKGTIIISKSNNNKVYQTEL